MNVSDGLIERMGFTPIPAGSSLAATFHSLRVFEVRGFNLEDDTVVTVTGSASGAAYTVGVGSGINAVSMALAGDIFTEDEEAWATKNKCTPPFLVVHFGPTKLHSVEKGWVKYVDEAMLTYDMFGAAKEELQRLEDEAMASVEMALACELTVEGHHVTLHPIERSVFGRTEGGATIHDLQMTVRASGYAARRLDHGSLVNNLHNAVALAETLDPRVSRFFQLGLRDTDRMKRFLYFFLAVEIEVHRAFAQVTKAAHLTNAAQFEPRLGRSLPSLLESRDNWMKLADRFVWCVASSWHHMNDDDVKEFKRLKGVRDAIAHGGLTSPDHADVMSIEALSKRIHD